MVSTLGLRRPHGRAAPVFAFGLVAFGFLGMGPVTIAVDSYGPVTDNAQSVFELSLIETLPEHQAREIKKDFGFDAELRDGQALPRGERRRRQHLQGHRQAGAHRHRRRRRHHDDLLDHRGAHRTASPQNLDKLSLLHPPFLLGLITGGAVIYWFTGASIQAVVHRRLPRGRVHQGEHPARGRRPRPRSTDSKKVVEICTQYAQKGMFNIFLDGVLLAPSPSPSSSRTSSSAT